jgi:predicted hydrocarbon binding protein
MENNDKTNWINTILSELSKTKSSQSISVLESCGRECLKSTSSKLDKIDAIRSNIKDKNDIAKLFKLYRERVYDNSDRLYMKDNSIHLIYEECACGMVKNGGVNNPFLCYCTLGYSKAIFERLFDRPVDVKLKKTILRGDSICEQEIILNNI